MLVSFLASCSSSVAKGAKQARSPKRGLHGRSVSGAWEVADEDDAKCIGNRNRPAGGLEPPSARECRLEEVSIKQTEGITCRREGRTEANEAARLTFVTERQHRAKDVRRRECHASTNSMLRIIVAIVGVDD